MLLAVPSCVPALPGFEDAGAVITPDDIREALGWEGVGGLGEMMNMPGVIESDPATHAMIGAMLDAGLPVTGHWSLHGWDDHRLHAYAAAGVDCDHETVLRSDALAKLRAGMWVQLREGSAWHDVEKLAPVLLEDGVDSRHALLVTDDMHPETLATVGHLNHAVRTAIAAGIDPLMAIQMATVNAAEYMGRRHDIGSIAPGRCADILLVEDLAQMRPHTVLADGEAIGGESPAYEYPARARDTVRIARTPTVEDLRIAASGESARVRAIGMVPGELATEHRVLEAPVVDGAVPADPAIDLAKAASIERHGGPGTIGVGFVQGLGLQRGAVASTVAHDNHNLLVVGHGRRRHARRRRAPARDRGRDGRRRRRRGHRRGAPAHRGPDVRSLGGGGGRRGARARCRLQGPRLPARVPVHDGLVPVARRHPGAAADQPRAGRRARVHARRPRAWPDGRAK